MALSADTASKSTVYGEKNAFIYPIVCIFNFGYAYLLFGPS